MDLSFPSEHRLHAAAEFSRVFAARRLIRGEFFDLHYLAARSIVESAVSSMIPATPESSLSCSATYGARLGLVMAKKLARRAVQRNLLKRLAREAFRHAHGSLPSYDLVLRLARPPGKSLEIEARAAWRADVDKLLVRLTNLPL